jgi:hypothetical protein
MLRRVDHGGSMIAGGGESAKGAAARVGARVKGGARATVASERLHTRGGPRRRAGASLVARRLPRGCIPHVESLDFPDGSEAFAGMAGLGGFTSAASAIAALQAQATDAPADTRWLWILALSFLLVAAIGAAGWMMTKEGAQEPVVRARADNQSTAQAAGRDIVNISTIATPSPSARSPEDDEVLRRLRNYTSACTS